MQFFIPIDDIIWIVWHFSSKSNARWSFHKDNWVVASFVYLCFGCSAKFASGELMDVLWSSIFQSSLKNKKKRRKTSSSKASYAKSLHRRKKQSEEFGVTNLKYFGSVDCQVASSKNERKRMLDSKQRKCNFSRSRLYWRLSFGFSTVYCSVVDVFIAQIASAEFALSHIRAIFFEMVVKFLRALNKGIEQSVITHLKDLRFAIFCFH